MFQTYRRGGVGGVVLLPILTTLVLATASSVRAATYSVPGFSETVIASGLSSPTDFALLRIFRIVVDRLC